MDDYVKKRKYMILIERGKMDNKDIKKGNAATQAKRKYNEKNYDRLYITVPAGQKEEIKKLSNSNINSFVVDAINEKIKNIKTNQQYTNVRLMWAIARK